MPLQVELLKPSEIDKAMDLLMEMHSEVSFTVGPPDRKKAIDALSQCVKYVVKEYDGSLGGILALREATVWYSKTPFLADLVFYVKPSFRSSRAALLLLRQAQKDARLKGLKLLVACNSGDDIERKENFYRRLGFQKIGASFKWES